MKAISTIIAAIVLVVITIGLVGYAYLFVSGFLTGETSKAIKLSGAKAHTVTIQNVGTDTIASDDIRILVEGEEVEIINPQVIEPRDTVVLKFVPPELKIISAEVKVISPSNTLDYIDDIIPHEFRVIGGTVGLWHFNSVNESYYTLDETDNHNDGLVSGATLVDGMLGKALEFDAVDDDFVIILDSNLWDFDGKEITVEVWFKAETDQPEPLGFPRFLDHFVGNPVNEGWWFGLYNNNIRFIHRPSGNGITLDSMNTYNDATWHHAAVTLNGTTAILYIDGSLDNHVEYSDLDDVVGPLNLHIGGQTTSYNFNGIIDDIRITYRALTQEQILDSIYG